jgi:hypothetical protein
MGSKSKHEISAKMRIICVPSTPHSSIPRVILYFIFNHFVYEAKFHGMEFSAYDFMSACKKFQNSETFRFWIFKIRHAQPK